MLGLHLLGVDEVRLLTGSSSSSSGVELIFLCIYPLNHQVHASPVPYTNGYVNTEHGILPVPAPATLQLMKGIPTGTHIIFLPQIHFASFKTFQFVHLPPFNAISHHHAYSTATQSSTRRASYTNRHVTFKSACISLWNTNSSIRS